MCLYACVCVLPHEMQRARFPRFMCIDCASLWRKYKERARCDYLLREILTITGQRADDRIFVRGGLCALDCPRNFIGAAAGLIEFRSICRRPPSASIVGIVFCVKFGGTMRWWRLRVLSCRDCVWNLNGGLLFNVMDLKFKTIQAIDILAYKLFFILWVILCVSMPDTIRVHFMN